QKKYNGKDIKEYLTKEVALRIIKEEKLEVIWYDEALKPLCAGEFNKFLSQNTSAKIIDIKA
ncbi:hypothetical protein VWN47_10765, partial [Campylobacter jejuni]